MKAFFRNPSGLIAGGLYLFCAHLSAQTNPVSPRITQSVEETNLVRLQGNVHPLAQAKYDQGAVADAKPMDRMLLILQHSEEQETSLLQLLEEQQMKSSANYHHWLTPEEFGKRFGPADADVQAVTDWLTSQGFQEIKVGVGRVVIEFSGSAGQVRRAFHAEIHNYLVNGVEHFANASDPEIPAALAPVVAGVVSLHNFPKQSETHRLGTFKRTKSSGEVQPEFTYINCGSTGTLPCYALGPSDFATIYGVQKLWDAGVDGTGQTIAIVGETNLNLQDVRDFRKMFGLPANDPQVILNGPDPGITSKIEETEADLDVEWSGAVAKNATIKLVISESTFSDSTAGIDLSALYIIDNNIAPVMSESYGACEASLGTSGNEFYKDLWQQAAAQGITVVISAGDNGSAACDTASGQTSTTHGLAVNGLASTPYNVALGGTDFYYTSANPATNYWNDLNSNNSGTGLSAKSYIPEITWNDSCAQSGGSGCTSVHSDGRDITAGSGGQSNCSTLNSGGTTCTAGYAKPAWQSGTGVPNDGVRDIPDVSLFSGNGAHNSFYIVCQADEVHHNSCSLTSGSLSFLGVGGTSASAPAFAGIMALVNQKTGARQGNANYVLYKLAATQNPSSCNATTGSGSNCIFNDVTIGNISVACTGGSPNCSASSGYGALVDPQNKSTPAWTTTNGYDRATGLGSVNAYNLVQNWSAASFTGTSTNLTLNNGNAVTITHGQSVPVKISVSASSGSATPTGDVSLIGNLSSSSSAGVGVGVFTLSGGTVSSSTNALPGGTYTVTAHYAGDGTNAASDSNTVSVAVAQENSKTAVSLVTFTSSGSVSNANATSAAYGSPYILRVDVTNNAGQKCSSAAVPCPTGSVTLTDNGTSLDNGTYVLNSAGYFEDQPIQLNAGSHPIIAKYAGDNSYRGSASPTDSITIAQASTTTDLTSSGTLIHSGDSVTLTAVVSTNSTGAAPTGTVQFYRGSSVISGTVAYHGVAGTSSTSAYLQATLTTALSSSMVPVGGMRRRPELLRGPALWVLVCGFVVFLIRVLGIPPAKRRGYAWAALFLFAVAAATSFAGCSGAGNASKIASITAKYNSDTNYKSSMSSAITITIQ